MYLMLFQGVDPTPLTEKLSEQVYVVFILALLIVVPLVGSVLGMAYAMLRGQSKQIEASRQQADNLISAFANEGKQQRDQAKEEADKQRAHHEAMIDKTITGFNTGQAITNSLIETKANTTHASITQMIELQRTASATHDKHLEGLKDMLDKNGDKLERVLGVVEDVRTIVQDTREDNNRHHEENNLHHEENKRYYAEMNQRLDNIDSTLAAIQKTVERGLEDTQPLDPQP